MPKNVACSGFSFSAAFKFSWALFFPSFSVSVVFGLVSCLVSVTPSESSWVNPLIYGNATQLPRQVECQGGRRHRRVMWCPTRRLLFSARPFASAVLNWLTVLTLSACPFFFFFSLALTVTDLNVAAALAAFFGVFTQPVTKCTSHPAGSLVFWSLVLCPVSLLLGSSSGPMDALTYRMPGHNKSNLHTKYYRYQYVVVLSRTSPPAASCLLHYVNAGKLNIEPIKVE